MIEFLSLGFIDGKPDFRFYEKNGDEIEETRLKELDEETLNAVNDLFSLFESKSDSIKEKISIDRTVGEIERRRKELEELERTLIDLVEIQREIT
ncbi:hypothetical protein [Alkalibacter mobilis]|uniref:hypothetical protein n=1 Tax=Alkalibacter mobilis TaxID=2787712 RepID=UPI00189FDA14|nr:hypothetical protein [Alkalibacter mobilis]MBF7097571.1 hypothetical protein [Alkalibacter mobilis]